MLQKLVWCEARGEDEKGQVLVANVVMNRVNNKAFPDTIDGVLFQKNQFEPVTYGIYEKAAPTNANIQAVSKALSGTDYSQGALYFIAAACAAGSWHDKNLTKLFQHGGHVFYK